LNRDGERKERFEAAQKAGMFALAGGTVKIADDVLPEAGEVAKAKLRVETRFRIAKYLHPEVFGDREGVNGESLAMGFVKALEEISERKKREKLELLKEVEVNPGG
jgi:hypothetical protein